MSEQKLEDKPVKKKKVSKKVAKKVSKKVSKKVQKPKAEVGSFMYLPEGQEPEDDYIFLGECVETGKKLYKKVK